MMFSLFSMMAGLLDPTQCAHPTGHSLSFFGNGGCYHPRSELVIGQLNLKLELAGRHGLRKRFTTPAPPPPLPHHPSARVPSAENRSQGYGSNATRLEHYPSHPLTEEGRARSQLLNIFTSLPIASFLSTIIGVYALGLGIPACLGTALPPNHNHRPAKG
jgi:hypothetical protein